MPGAERGESFTDRVIRALSTLQDVPGGLDRLGGGLLTGHPLPGNDCGQLTLNTRPRYRHSSRHDASVRHDPDTP
jgi:hypothetical protein